MGLRGFLRRCNSGSQPQVRDGWSPQGCGKSKTHKDVMTLIHMMIGGTILMVPVISAPNAYLKRLGPKPLNFGAPPRPLEDVLARLPILYTDLPSKPIASSQSSSNVPIDDPFYLWPLPSTPPGDEPINDFPRLPDNWVKSRLGVEPSPITLQEPNNSNWDAGTTIQTLRPPNSLSPESLIRFFGTPGSHKDSATAVQVPFIPGAPSTPQSSSAVFRQD